MKRLITAIAVLASCATAIAHPGPRVWIGSAGGALTTYTSNNDLSPTSYILSRVFIGGVNEDTLVANGLLDEYPVPGTGIFATDFPGFQVRLDGNSGLSTGRSFGFKLAGPLLAYDTTQHILKTTQQMFASPGPVPQMNLSVGASSIVTSTGGVNGFNFYSYNTASDHAHLTTTLLGNGVSAVDGPHVVYAVQMKLTTSGVKDSQPFYVLYGRGISSSQQTFQDALHFTQAAINLPGDANLDGHVDLADAKLLASHWRSSGTWLDGDFNFDGYINVSDLYDLAKHWQGSNAQLSLAMTSLGLPDVSVPEPASAVSFGLLSLAILARRQRRKTKCPEVGHFTAR